MLVWEEDMVRALRKEGESLREENARLKARLVEMYERIIPEEIAKGLERLTRERDEARAAVERLALYGVPPGDAKKRIDQLRSEVKRLQELILELRDHTEFSGQPMGEKVYAEAKRIRGENP